LRSNYQKGDTSRDRGDREPPEEQPLPEDHEHVSHDQTDWAYLDAMTGEEAHRNALADPDNPPLSPQQLANMWRVPNPKQLRLRLNMTQEEFARHYQIGLYTLRDWEEGVRRPDSIAKSYLRVIAAIPDAVRQALNADLAEREAPGEHDTASRRRRAG
jgi:putative transcriptional regulator